VAAVLLPVDGGLLTVRRSIGPGDGQWTFPGGFVNYGESWQAAAARELFEETGIRLDDPQELGVFHVSSTSRGHMVIIFGLAKPRQIADLPPFQPTTEASEIGIIQEPVNLAFPQDTKAAEQYFAARKCDPDAAIIATPNPSLWQQAAAFAARCHRGQMRRDGQTPYISHPFRVALTVRDVFGVEDPTALCIALLHDVIEDTTTDFDDVQAEFGSEVAEAVACLTKDKRLPETQREIAFYEQIDRSPWRVRLVKLADGYDNLCDCLASRGSLEKTLDRTRRALALRRDQPCLEEAASKLKQLLETSEQAVGPRLG
jgi:ADP-ribose pyrophosphatase YjhB (NUDIX family)/5'-deoxynucleotidase YfbR-like HD superfamily hydrolase